MCAPHRLHAMTFRSAPQPRSRGARNAASTDFSPTRSADAVTDFRNPQYAHCNAVTPGSQRRSAPHPSQGNFLLDLTGNVGRGKGVVSDPIAVVAGGQYRLDFDVGAFWVAGYGSFGDATVEKIDAALKGDSIAAVMPRFDGTGPRKLLARAGTVNPSSLDDYRSRGGDRDS